MRKEDGLGLKNMEGHQHLRKNKNLQRNSEGIIGEVGGKLDEWGIMERKVGDLAVAEAFNSVKCYRMSIKIRTEEYPLELVIKKFLIILAIAI